MKKSCVILFFSTCIAAAALAQQPPSAEQFEDLEALAKKGFFKEYFKGMFAGFTDFGEPFDLNGGLGVNMRSYSALGTTPRQDPFFYAVNASANARIYKLNAPFSLMISAKNKEAAYPKPKEFIDAFKNNLAAQKQRYVRFGTSPRYKWIKTHFGHRSMNFSQYTMSNLVFLGAGTELTPGKLRLSAMYGRLAKAEPIDLSLVAPNIPKFERKGWGVKVGYGTPEDFIEAVLFQAKDDPGSIFIPDTLPAQVAPEHNEALGLVAQKTFFEKFKFKLDFGASALSPNAEDAPAGNHFPHPSFLFQGRATTNYKTAFESSLDYQAKFYTLGLKYKRVDPNYKTLGAYFFNSDIEDWTLNLSTTLLQGALTLNSAGGLQRNNLDGTKPNRLTRKIIGSFDGAYNKGALNLTANYSNNASDVAYLLDPQDPILNVIIITQDAGFTATYSLQDSSQNQHVFNLTGNAQIVTDDVEDPATSSFSRMLVGNFIYTLALAAGQWSLNGKATFNQNELTSQLVRRYGAGFGIAKNLFKGKINTGLDYNFFFTVTEGFGKNNNATAAFRLNWNVSDVHAIAMNWNYLQTKNVGAGATDQFGEVVGTLAYQYTFIKKKKAADGEAKPKKKRKKGGEEALPAEENNNQ
ncbi:MAG: hypothetical protein AAB316_04680 [Bacteroidota bacterium]